MAYRETYSNAIYPPNLDAADNTQSYIPTGESSEDTKSRICCHQALIVLLEDQKKGGFVVRLRGKVAISGLFVAVTANKLGTRSVGASSLFRLCIQQRIGGFRNAVRLVRAILVISILTRAKYANLATFRAI